jgi:hypothetical protein
LKATVFEVVRGIYHLGFARNSKLCDTVLRFSEYYESPRFKGRVFTRKEFADWYAREYGNGIFSYASDYSGFNFPSYVLSPFYSGAFDPLTREEKALLACFRGLAEPFYIIGTSYDTVRMGVLDHELAHGLWAMREEYRILALSVVRSVPDVERMKIAQFLAARCYHSDSFDDEMHAFLLDERFHRSLELEGLGFQMRELQRLLRQFGGDLDGVLVGCVNEG